MVIVQLDTRFILAIQCLTIYDTALLCFKFLLIVFTSAYPDTSEESLAGIYFPVVPKTILPLIQYDFHQFAIASPLALLKLFYCTYCCCCIIILPHLLIHLVFFLENYTFLLLAKYLSRRTNCSHSTRSRCALLLLIPTIVCVSVVLYEFLFLFLTCFVSIITWLLFALHLCTYWTRSTVTLITF